MRWPREARRSISVFALLAIVAVVFALALFEAVSGSRSTEHGCWVLPNGSVLVMPGDFDCESPELADVASGRATTLPVDLSDSKDHGLRRLFAGGLLAAALLAIPVSLGLRSRAAASLPFLLLYTLIAIVTIVMHANRQNVILLHTALGALLLLPATIAHLNLTALRARQVLSAAPQLVFLPYAFAIVLLPVGVLALHRAELLWRPLVFFVAAATGAGSLLLLLSSWFAIRESSAPLERARGRLLFYGGLVLPLLPAVLLVRSNPTPMSAAVAYLWSSAAFLPLPIGLAISRYNLFNLEWDARRAIGRVVYVLGVGLTVTLGALASLKLWGLPPMAQHPELLFALTVVCAGLAEPVRTRLLPLIEARLAPRLEGLRARRERFTEIAASETDEDEVGRLLGDTIVEAMNCAFCAVFVSGRHPRLSYACGDLASDAIALGPLAESELAERWLVHFPQHLETPSPAQRRLEAAGIEVVSRLGASTDLGLILVGARSHGGPYAGAELDFITVVASHAETRIRELRATEERVAAEQRAAAGRVAVSLVHDLGKEVAWLRRLAERLPTRVSDPDRLMRDVRMIREFADNVTDTIEAVANEARATRTGGSGYPLDYLLDSAIEGVERVRPRAAISKTVEPDLRNRVVSADIGRITRNLLDNAVLAGGDDGTVHLFATSEQGALRLTVSDSGTGMSEVVRKRAFETGFSTRRESGGLGIGLSVSRDLARELAGSLDLEPRPGGGTVATLRVPLNGNA